MLPAAIHDCTLDELKNRFGSFQISDRRLQLFRRFEQFVADAQAAQFPRDLVIDGSFVTGEPAPNDIDLVLVLPQSHDLTANLLPGQYNLVSRRSVRRRYGFDIVVVRENTVEYEEAVAFFQQVRGQPALRKGILNLTL